MYIRLYMTLVVCVGKQRGEIVTTVLKGQIKCISPFIGKDLESFPDPVHGEFLVQQELRDGKKTHPYSGDLIQKSRDDLVKQVRQEDEKEDEEEDEEEEDEEEDVEHEKQRTEDGIARRTSKRVSTRKGKEKDVLIDEEFVANVDEEDAQEDGHARRRRKRVGARRAQRLSKVQKTNAIDATTDVDWSPTIDDIVQWKATNGEHCIRDIMYKSIHDAHYVCRNNTLW